jgi:hypothetical protein
MDSVTFEERAECLNAIKTKRTSGHCVGTFVAVIYHFLTLKICFSLLPLSLLSLFLFRFKGLNSGFLKHFIILCLTV